MFDKLKRLIKNRHLYVFIFLLVITFTILVRLFDWQVINGEAINYEASIGHYATRDIPAQRGKIFDRNGKLIAYNRTGYVVQIVPNTNSAEKRNKIYLELVRILEKNGDSYTQSLEKYIKINPYAFGEKLAGDDETAINARNSFVSRIVVADSDKEELEGAGPKALYNYMKETTFKISDEYSPEETYKIMNICFEVLWKGVSSRNPLVLAEDISVESMSEIETRHIEFTGIATEEVYYRQYTDPTKIAHLLGYVRSMSSEEYTNVYKDKGYDLDEIVGKEGIEKAAEEYLRGTDGEKTVYVDKSGREIEEISSIPALPGDDVYLTIDLELQEVALKSLMENIERIRSEENGKNNHGDANAGSVVVSNPKTGEVLAMVNYPTFNPNIFLAPSDDKEAQKQITQLYQDSVNSPSLNRATQGLYAPGSTFKLLTGIAGLETNTITQHTTYYCGRTKSYDGLELACMGHHGTLDLVEAITKSCNIYFYDSGIDTGIKALDYWMKAFGLGESTGIEIPEYIGNRSNAETMRLKDPDLTHIWGRADTAQTSIGQLYHQYTPLQLVNFVSAFGNGGYLTDSYLIQKAVGYNGETTFKTEPNKTKLDVSEENLEVINKGMLGVINDAGNRVERLFDNFGVTVAGKTGTPETGMEAFGHSSHGVFVCYAPADDPEIAISIVLEHGVWGSNATPIAKDILEKYFNLGQYVDDEYELAPQDSIVMP